MIKTVVSNKFLLATVIFVCAIFTFGGAVNLGFSGFLMALPFMILWVLTASMAGKKTILISFVIFLAILFFYFLKLNESKIFFPANNREIVLNQDACFDFYTSEHSNPKENFILANSLASELECLNNKQSKSSVKRSRIVIKGTKFKIFKTEVSWADFGEHFRAVVQDSEGTLTIFNPEIFDFTDGTKLTEDNLRQPYLYYPSLLMYWPVFPVIFSHK